MSRCENYECKGCGYTEGDPVVFVNYCEQCSRWECKKCNRVVLYNNRGDFRSKMCLSCPLDKDDSCPICYLEYGLQEDGTFLCKDGIDNSGYESSCKHYICVKCCWQLSRIEEVRCPLCREDWTEWIFEHYEDEDDDDSEDEDE
jgi:hypothetical protein